MSIFSDENGNPYAKSVSWCFMMTSIINVIVGIIFLLLIRYMHRTGRIKMNMYVWIVFWMMLNQIFCDLTLVGYVLTNLKLNEELFGKFIHFSVVFFGTSVAVWNTSLMYMIWYSTRENSPMIDETKTLYRLGFFTILLALILGCQALSVKNDNLGSVYDVYEVTRLALAFLTMIIVFLLLRKLYATTTAATRFNSPMYRLLRKLVWYPIGTAFLRFYTIPYNYVYKVNLYDFSRTPDIGLLITLWSNAILVPSQALLDLIIFVRVRNALTPLLELLCLKKVADTTVDKEDKNAESLKNSQLDVHAKRIRAPSQNQVDNSTEEDRDKSDLKRLDSMDEGELLAEMNKSGKFTEGGVELNPLPLPPEAAAPASKSAI